MEETSQKSVLKSVEGDETIPTLPLSSTTSVCMPPATARSIPLPFAPNLPSAIPSWNPEEWKTEHEPSWSRN